METRKGVFILSNLIVIVLGRQGFGPTDQEWGYATVRDGAHIFWWMHYTNAVQNPLEKPLVIWLQGGPGVSSTGYGNFVEIGPWDANKQPRNTTWLNYANLLFVDNPVGTGFSYVDYPEAYATNNTQIAKDFIELLRSFYKRLPDFEKVPLYIFSESYGGKMTAEIALHVYWAVKNGTIKCNLKGVGLGDAWISPIDSITTWHTYLYNMGMIDKSAYGHFDKVVEEAKVAESQGNYTELLRIFFELENDIDSYTINADFYNILTPIRADFRNKKNGFGNILFKPAGPEDEIETLMKKEVAPALNVTHNWGSQGDDVFVYLQDDFMRSVTKIVEQLLNETDIIVGVYNGQLDLIVDTIGIYRVSRIN
ncbi:retinoid-inducible serine carboxypeptidase-like isoform X2 [Cylas formicarius]|uniref:retinoid-inducible serine carboxypeptidase-like isoform X2 n=1 Tax=Cylas formicarius TaxID=197179 RepID=UPI0029587148|nr:retinoid-inducible serine carboxypeptidase-like isoform X2 [Cylas formicarius]